MSVTRLFSNKSLSINLKKLIPLRPQRYSGNKYIPSSTALTLFTIIDGIKCIPAHPTISSLTLAVYKIWKSILLYVKYLSLSKSKTSSEGGSVSTQYFFIKCSNSSQTSFNCSTWNIILKHHLFRR